MDQLQQETLNAVVRVLCNCRSILFITGAGISADSGMPTYRGIGGLYEIDAPEEGVQIEEILSGPMLKSNPELTWKYLAQIAEAARGARHNRAHEVISEMEQHYPRVWTLTQNVDGLHRLAGAQNVIEIHGNMRSLSCTACVFRRVIDDIESERIPPQCPHCNAVMRPEDGLFEEMLPDEAVKRLRRELEIGFGAIVSIGTSAVFPYIQSPLSVPGGWVCPQSKSTRAKHCYPTTSTTTLRWALLRRWMRSGFVFVKKSKIRSSAGETRPRPHTSLPLRNPAEPFSVDHLRCRKSRTTCRMIVWSGQFRRPISGREHPAVNQRRIPVFDRGRRGRLSGHRRSTDALVGSRGRVVLKQNSLRRSMRTHQRRSTRVRSSSPSRSWRPLRSPIDDPKSRIRTSSEPHGHASSRGLAVRTTGRHGTRRLRRAAFARFRLRLCRPAWHDPQDTYEAKVHRQSTRHHQPQPRAMRSQGGTERKNLLCDSDGMF
jgi:NAD-dependent deacetylase